MVTTTEEAVKTCAICGENYKGIHVEVGMCMACRRWRDYGVPCKVCGSNQIDLRQVITGELKRDYVDLIMLTQDLLFEHEPLVKDACDPRRWANMTNSWLRQRIEALRGIAAFNGLQLPTGVLSAAGREVVRSIDGEDWLCLETPNGLTMLHRVEGKAEGDFLCQWCKRSFRVRIAWFRHEPACASNPAVIARK